MVFLQTAVLDLPISEPLPLGGYTARGGKPMELGGEPLYARVAILTQGPTKVALVAVDTLTIPESLVREVSKTLPAGAQLFMVATHTHCAPDSQALNDRMTFSIPGIATFKPRLLEMAAARISEAIHLADRAPMRSVSRFTLDQVPLELNRGRRPGAKPQREASFLSVGSEPFFVSYPAHATLLGPERNQPAGDWPGALARRSGALVVPGAIGDVSPNLPGEWPDRPAKFAEKALDAWAKWPVRTSVAATLSVRQEPIKLDPPSPHPEFAKSNKIPEALAKTLASRFAPTEAKITLVKIGGVAIVGVPGEPTSHLGRQIEAYGRRLGYQATITVSHTNGWIGYILDPADYARGGYEATLAMHGPSAGTRVVEAAKRALRY